MVTPVRVRGFWWRLHDFDASACGRPGELRAELRVVVADQLLRAFAPRGRLAQLLGDPLVAREPRGVEVDDLARVVIDDEKREDGAKQRVESWRKSQAQMWWA